MPYILKPNELFARDPNNNRGYLPQNVIATQTADEQIEMVEEAGASTIAAVQQAVSDSQAAVASIDSQRDAMIAAIASIAGSGTDTTLTQPDVAADAAACGDLKSAFESYKRAIIDIYNDDSWTSGSINGTGQIVSPTYNNFYSAIIPKEYFKNGYIKAIDNDYQYSIAYYDNGTFITKTGYGQNLMMLESQYDIRIIIATVAQGTGKTAAQMLENFEIFVNSIDNIIDYFGIGKLNNCFQNGAIDLTTGKEMSSSTRCKTPFLYWRSGTTIAYSVPSGVEIAFVFYDNGYNFISATEYKSGTSTQINGTSGNICKVIAKKTDGSSTISPTDLNNIELALNLCVDPSLSKTNKAPDSKVVGDEIKALKATNELKSYGFEFGGIKGTGELVENTVRVRSVLIDIPKGTDNVLRFFGNSEYTIAQFVLYAIDGSATAVSIDWGKDSIIEVPINDPRIQSFRIAFKKGNAGTDEFTQAEVNALYVKIVALPYTPLDVYTKLNNRVNCWNGKKYAALGDSITYGFIPRNDADYPGQLDSYAKLTAEKLGMEFANYGISGSSVSNVTGRNPMCIRYTDLPDDADLITFMGGANDIRNNVHLGTMADRGNTTYYGALHTLLGGLYKKYMIDQGVTIGKTKKIVAITPIKLLEASSASSETGEGTIQTDIDGNSYSLWAEAVKEVAAYYSIPCLDFYNLSGINPQLDRTVHGWQDQYTGYYNPYITDGTHPNQEGAEIMANVLTGFLKTLI